MFLDEPLQHLWSATSAPDEIRADDCNRASDANLQAVRLDAHHPAPNRKPQLLLSALEIVSRFPVGLLVAALGFGLVRAEEDMVLGHAQPDPLENGGDIVDQSFCTAIQSLPRLHL